MRVILIAFFILSVPAWAKGPHVKVTLGYGQVQVQSDGISQWPSEKFQELETDLLIDERLAPFVTGKKPVEVVIFEDEFLTAIRGTEQLDQVKNTIFDKAILVVRAQQLEKSETEAEGDLGNSLDPALTADQGVKQDWDDQRIVVGSTVEVGEGEFLEEIVVIAGKANIRGTVGRIVVIGGEVHLFDTAKVTEELNIIGGHVIRDPGSQVIGKQVKVAVPLSQNTWTMVFDGLEGSPIGPIFSSVWGSLFFLLLKVLILMIVSVVAHRVSPSYQDEVHNTIAHTPVATCFWGLFSIALIFPTMILLCLSLIGLPLLPMQFSMIFLFGIIGYTQVGHVLVRKISEISNIGKGLNGWVFIFLGILLLELFSIIPVVGGAIVILMAIAGFGSASKVFYQAALKRKPTALTLRPIESSGTTAV